MRCPRAPRRPTCLQRPTSCGGRSTIERIQGDNVEDQRTKHPRRENPQHQQGSDDLSRADRARRRPRGHFLDHQRGGDRSRPQGRRQGLRGDQGFRRDGRQGLSAPARFSNLQGSRSPICLCCAAHPPLEEQTMWNQVYNPFASEVLSTLVAALPVVTLLALIASGKVKAHLAAVIALAVALGVAVYAFTMPGGMAIRAAILGLATGRAATSVE